MLGTNTGNVERETRQVLCATWQVLEAWPELEWEVANQGVHGWAVLMRRRRSDAAAAAAGAAAGGGGGAAAAADVVERGEL
jgi:hypothetical protein